MNRDSTRWDGIGWEEMGCDDMGQYGMIWDVIVFEKNRKRRDVMKRDSTEQYGTVQCVVGQESALWFEMRWS